MRIQVLSDVHLEIQEAPPLPETGADVIVLAGDIGAGAEGVEWAGRNWPDRPVIYVIGNHEFYNGKAEQVFNACRQAARGSSVHVLERDAVTIDGVRFLGATLWTNFALHGAQSAATSRDAARHEMPDFQLIGQGEGSLKPETTVDWHEHACAWIEDALASAFDGPSVVVSHHAPHPCSNHYPDDPMAPAFVSDLSELIVRTSPAVWIHGHTHTSEDYRVGATRVVANQLGYADETTGWTPNWTIDVPG